MTLTRKLPGHCAHRIQLRLLDDGHCECCQCGTVLPRIDPIIAQRTAEKRAERHDAPRPLPASPPMPKQRFPAGQPCPVTCLNGKPCTKIAYWWSGLCGTHERTHDRADDGTVTERPKRERPERVTNRCQGKTLKGTPCKRLALPHSHRCMLHTYAAVSPSLGFLDTSQITLDDDDT